MRTTSNIAAGAVHHLAVDSQVLAGNLLGDPTRRAIDVYVPAGHDGGGLPLLVDIVGFTAGGPVHTNWKNFGENVPERLDRLIATGAMPPVVVAFPDCFTRLGGNQYVNSAAMGRWDDFLRAEAVPFVEVHLQLRWHGPARPLRQVQRRLRRDGARTAAPGLLECGGRAFRRHGLRASVSA